MNTEELKNLILTEFADRFSSAEDVQLFLDTAEANILSANNYINLDGHDIIGILEGSEKVYITTIEGSMDEISRLLNEAHARIQAMKGDLKLCKLLMQLQFDRNSGFTIDKTVQISDFMSALPSDIDIIWGTGFDDTLNKDVRFTLIEGFKA